MSHANAALTPRARLRWRVWSLTGLVDARAANVMTFPGRPRSGGPIGIGAWDSRDERCLLAATALSEPDSGAGGAQDRAPALEAALGPGADRGPGRLRTLHCARGVGPVRHQPAHPSRSGTGEPIRRYEHHPGAMLHVDVKKLGNVPDGGGWRFLGRQAGDRNRQATPGKPKNKWHNPKIGTAFVHTVLDDHSRVAYAEIHDDETAATATAVLRNAVAWFADRGVVVERVLSDNGSGLQGPPLARHLRRAGHHSEEDSALPPPDQRQDRTLPPHPGRRLGVQEVLQLRDQPAAQLCQHGSTTTTTTGPTPQSGAKPPISRLINLSDQYS